ncbi:MAG: sulfatase-like hydrolase/transferase [Thermoguttaceae bacterium]
MREEDCRLSHTRPVWRLENGQAVLVAYEIYRGPRNQYGKILGVFGRSEFGAEITLAIAYQVYIVALSFDKVCLLMNFFQHLKLWKSQADALLKQLARQWQEEFDRLCLLLANSLVVHTDETGWSYCRCLLGAPLAALPAEQAMAAAEAAERPNILFIMSDDHAAQAVSAYNGRINRTPNLDRPAREGMRLDTCFCTNSICTPSRASIITGKYSHKNGLPVFNRFDRTQPTVAKYLQAAGYYAGMIGKWHLGGDPTGFDYWNIVSGRGVYFDPRVHRPVGPPGHSGLTAPALRRKSH